jgi:hypothetical protein
MFNLAQSEPLALVQELPRFDNTIKLKILLANALTRVYTTGLVDACSM